MMKEKGTVTMEQEVELVSIKIIIISQDTQNGKSQGIIIGNYY